MAEQRTSHADRLTRRTLLAATAGGAAALAGCLGDDTEPAPDPVTIESGQRCDNCTMAITDYPGPVGQAFYDDPGEVLEGGEAGGDDPDRPAQFCSALCTYTFHFDTQETADPTAIYLTDYSNVEYDVDDGPEPDISSHVDAESFALAGELTQVADSEVSGAMGDALVGFSDSADATAFSDQYGGDHYDHDDVSRELVMSLMN